MKRFPLIGLQEMRENNTIIHKYIVRPFQLIIKNRSVILLVMVVLILDNINNILTESLGLSFNPNNILNGVWVFEYLPTSLLDIFGQSWFILGTVVLTIAQTLITVLTMVDLKLTYQYKKHDLRRVLGETKFSYFSWYFAWLVGSYTAYLALIIGVYFLSSLIWFSTRTNTIVVALAFVAFIFPFFYSLLSIGAKISVTSSHNKFVLMKHILIFEKLKKIYLFYVTRLSIEIITLIIVPIISLHILKSSWLAIPIGIVILVIPLSVFRASTFEFFLYLFKDDKSINLQFYKHFEAN